MENKDTLYKVCDGVELSGKPDKVWLHFESKSGQQCSFCVNAKFPRICSEALCGWAYDMMAGPERRNIMDQPINIIFDGPPNPNAGRFVEVETDDGKSITAGEWREREDGLWALRITQLPPKL